jgi:hypothetical protein
MPSSMDALLIVILVVTPGYILARSTREVIAFDKNSSDIFLLLPAIAGGTTIQLLLYPWSNRIYDFYRDGALRQHSEEFILWGLSTLFVVPLILGVVIGQLSNVDRVDSFLDKIGLGYIDRMPSAWDYVLRLEQSAYVKVYLKDGGIIGGEFSTKSFASTNPHRPDLFLEKVWHLDKNHDFAEALVDNWGVWITHDSISHIEFFSGNEDGNQEEST